MLNINVSSYWLYTRLWHRGCRDSQEEVDKRERCVNMQEEGTEGKAGVSETGRLAGFLKLGLNPERGMQ